MMDEKDFAEKRAALVQYNVAAYLHEGLMLYLERHLLPGRFLIACLENNLTDALSYASTRNWDYIFNVVNFLCSCVPIYAWGSKEIVRSWVKCKGKGVQIAICTHKKNL